MAQTIPLQSIPNQTVSVALDNQRYELTLKTVGTVMAADLLINEVLILQGARLVGGTPLIPYRYLQNGNFLLTTEDNCYPFYTLFGVTQFLVYFSPAELGMITSG